MTKPATKADMKSFIQAFFDEVWTDGNCDRIEHFIAPAYVIRSDPGDPWDGQTLDRSEFVRRLTISRAPFPDQSFHIDEIHIDDDVAAISWGWRGTHLADMPGFPASGRRIKTSGLTFYYFEKGLLCGHRQQTDRSSVYQQLAAR
jgi:steroid delta-isomerase-like uncharacterized protein